MSANPRLQAFRQRVAGRWQVPLLLFSTLLFMTALLFLRPQPQRPPITEHVQHLRSFKEGLLLAEAEALARLILADERYERQELGPVYAELADIQYRIQKRFNTRDDKALINTLANYEQAEVLSFQLDGDDYAHRGEIYEWLHQPSAAIKQFRSALTLKPSDVLDIRRRVLALQHGQLQTPRDALHAGYDALIVDARQRPGILEWALSGKVALLIEEGRAAQAQQFIDDNASYLDNTPYAPAVQYLNAWVAYQTGRYDEAELILRDLRSRLSGRGPLHAKSGWLLGKIVLMDDGPQRPMEALVYFKDVLDSHTTGEYVTASKLGMAEALSDLERFDEAVEFYRRVINDLRNDPSMPGVNHRMISSSLVVRSRLLEDDGKYDEALEYYQLAVDLIDLTDAQSLTIYMPDLIRLKEFVAGVKRQRAVQALESELTGQANELSIRSRELYLSAADDYLTLAHIRRADENAAAEALWKAAEMYDEAGQRGEAISILENFITSRPHNLHIPMALFKLGQAYQAEGQLLEAVARYQECIAHYPQTRPTQLALIPLADCFVMLGPDYAQQAVDTLRYILDPDPNVPFMFTPQSNIYREALFKLGVVYSRNQRYEDAIYRLSEALQRYPEDPNATRATFLLADAYRHSGLELARLAAEMKNALRREEMYDRYRQRLRHAEKLFGEVIARLTGRPHGPGTDMQALQLKLSYLYRADCAFDLNQYERAHALYEEVVQKYQEDPATLSAYVQIISCLEKLDRIAEIKPALERAQYLTNKIDTQKYQDALFRRSKNDWQRAFAWLAETQEYR